jgi:hypothetical protein
MSKVINDPVELYEFAKKLQHKVAEAQELHRMLEQDLRNIGEAWRDEMYHDFSEYFQSNQKVLQAMYEKVEAFSIHATILSGKLDEVINTKFRG